MNRRWMSCLVFMLCMASACRAEELHFIAGDLPPLQMPGPDGQPEGATMAVMQALAQEMNVPLTVLFRPFPRALFEAETGSDIALIGISRIPEREKQFQWVGPLVRDTIVLVTKKGVRHPPATLGEARNWRVGALRHGVSSMALNRAGFTDIEDQKDWEVGARMLDGGHVDAWAVSRLGGPYAYRSLGLDPAELEIGPVVCPNEVYLAFSLDVPETVVAVWRAALDRLRAKGLIETLTAPFLQ